VEGGAVAVDEATGVDREAFASAPDGFPADVFTAAGIVTEAEATDDVVVEDAIVAVFEETAAITGVLTAAAGTNTAAGGAPPPTDVTGSRGTLDVGAVRIFVAGGAIAGAKDSGALPDVVLLAAFN